MSQQRGSWQSLWNLHRRRKRGKGNLWLRYDKNNTHIKFWVIYKKKKTYLLKIHLSTTPIFPPCLNLSSHFHTSCFRSLLSVRGSLSVTVVRSNFRTFLPFVSSCITEIAKVSAPDELWRNSLQLLLMHSSHSHCYRFHLWERQCCCGIRSSDFRQ